MEIVPREQPKETIIAQWQEPAREQVELGAQGRILVIAMAAVVTAGLIGMGIWQKNFSYYLGALVPGVAAASIIMQNKHGERSRKITLSKQFVAVDTVRHPIAELAGFWMARDGEHLVINIEGKRPKLIPLSFFYPTLNTNEARQILTQALPEVEPRYDQSGGVNRYFRF